MTIRRSLLLLTVVLAVACQVRAVADDASSANGETPTLTADQAHAVGIETARPKASETPTQVTAFGQIIDPTDLIEDLDRLRSARAASVVANAAYLRLKKLYDAGTGAALKDVEQARATRVQAMSREAEIRDRLQLRWRPVLQQSNADIAKLLRSLRSGSVLLVRADLVGQHRLARLPKAAQLDLDGQRLAATVLGALPRASPTLQGVGLLLRVDHPPLGLAVGARMPVTLDGPAQRGVVISARALLYDTQGAYVFLKLPNARGSDRFTFTARPVRLLQRIGGDWLVQGLDASDDVVVHGAGVLWSQQGLSGMSGGDDDD